jgi:Rrf2 family transcriptional regulator, iron-sulfur cluster assembly transcription factor
VRLSGHAVYAVHALAALARVEGGRPLKMKYVAAGLGLSRAMLHKVTCRLRRAGLLAVTMGPQGGCHLARPAKDITLLDVVEAVDGPWATRAEWLGEAPAALAAQVGAVCQAATEAERRLLAKVTLAGLAGAADGKH